MIGVFDSGAGGLSVLREALKVLPGESYAYYSDNAHCPYGEKSAAYVTDRARQITEFLLGKGAQIIVVACNTATSAAISTLRAEYSDSSDPAVRQKVLRLTSGRQDHVMFIGMEPAVKPAAALTRSGVIGVLATAGTLSGSKYLDARELYASKARIVEQPGKGFVEMVESGRVDDEVIALSLGPLLDAGADVIVLGCSHYPFLLEGLRRVAARLVPERKVTFIDPAPAVAARLLCVMNSEGLLPSGPSPCRAGVHESSPESSPESTTESSHDSPAFFPRVDLYASGPDTTLRRLYNSII